MRRALTPCGWLAVINTRLADAPWDRGQVGRIIARYSTNQDFVPADLLDELVKRGLFAVEGKQATSPARSEQTVAEYVEYHHSMSSLSRAKMRVDAAEAFDEEMRAVFAPHAKNGVLSFETVVDVAWGRPCDPA